MGTLLQMVQVWIATVANDVDDGEFIVRLNTLRFHSAWDWSVLGHFVCDRVVLLSKFAALHLVSVFACLDITETTRLKRIIDVKWRVQFFLFWWHRVQLDSRLKLHCSAAYQFYASTTDNRRWRFSVVHPAIRVSICLSIHPSVLLFVPPTVDTYFVWRDISLL